MRTLIGVAVLLPLLAACSDVRLLGAAAAEKRRVMNDMQARATMAAVCDMSLGAYLRELNGPSAEMGHRFPVTQKAMVMPAWT